MKLAIIIVLLIFFLLTMFLLVLNTTTRYLNVKIDDYVLKAEIANTPEKRMKGLMGVSQLEENHGMLFVFDEKGHYKFWMMNMTIPIDIIFIDDHKIVVDIWKDAQPCKINCTSYGPQNEIMYVLETNANFTDRHDIEIGSQLYFGS
jgi:uncharacterized protein